MPEIDYLKCPLCPVTLPLRNDKNYIKDYAQTNEHEIEFHKGIRSQAWVLIKVEEAINV